MRAVRRSSAARRGSLRSSSSFIRCLQFHDAVVNASRRVNQRLADILVIQFRILAARFFAAGIGGQNMQNRPDCEALVKNQRLSGHKDSTYPERNCLNDARQLDLALHFSPISSRCNEKGLESVWEYWGWDGPSLVLGYTQTPIRFLIFDLREPELLSPEGIQSMIVRSRAPVRIDFAGGWTDVDIFARGSGGAVLNATINHHVTGVLNSAETSGGTTPAEHGHPTGGLRVTYYSELPAGSGLGTSSALNVVWLSLVHPRVATDDDRARIAELAYQLEAMLGIVGGKQDQYASAFGGFNFMTFQDEAKVERLKIDPEVIRRLEDRLVLCYTGKPRLSTSIHENVWGAFRRGVPRTVHALYQLRRCAIRMRPVLLRGDIEGFASLLSLNWKYQKALDPSVSNPEMDELFDVAAGAGAIGGKACGAGGGGCVLFCAAEGRREAVSSAAGSAGAQIIPFQFDMDGLQVKEDRDH